ncbi:MAG: hypothetical protein C4582_08775 [Desulfobacteraceae bacterium]|jgi:hypothetical protein|nr:MAG: hypothetical protein C4582_08775 [Desulfobacteraceae bacterium]
MEFCDLTCRHASWPREEAMDGSGSCMTFKALYCSRKAMHVYKNMPCAEKEKRTPKQDMQVRAT